MMGYLKTDQDIYNQASLYDRVKKLLMSDDWSDCSFSVANKNFKAHKLILGISSPVFEAMFYGPLSSHDDIEITDIEPDIFQLIINYIYTDKVEITTIDQAFELLYASRKYMLEHLTQMCISYIKTNISVDNVVEILNYPEYMQDKQLISYSLKLFCQHTNYLLQEKKDIITYPCMKALLECDQMNIAEKDLIMHVFEWTTYCCKRNKVPATLDNRREILKTSNLFELLRFSTLTLDELVDIVMDANNLVLPHEYEYLKNILKSSSKMNDKDVVGPIGMVNVPRNLLKLQWQLCYRSPIRSVAPIVIDSNNYIIQTRLKVNKSIFINSLCVPTRMAPVLILRNTKDITSNVYAEQLTVSISSETDNSVIKLTNFMDTVEYDSMVNIEFPEPCFVKRDEWYKVCFVWPRNRFQSNSYMVEFRHNQCTGQKVTFEFDDLSICSRNSGSFLGGLKFCL